MKVSLNKNHLLEYQSHINPNKIGLQTDLKKYTYLEIFEWSKKAAEYFSQKGIKKNHHVSIYSDNNFEFVIAINALWFLGAIPIPLNIRLKENEIEKLLIHSQASFLIVIKKVLNFDFIGVKQTVAFSHKNINSINTIDRIEKFNPKNIAVMIYSSGSTGDPKLAQLSFNNLYSSFISANSFINHNEKDKWLATLPFYHIGGFSIITRSFIAGTILSIPKSLKEVELIKSFNRFHPSLISMVPTQLKRLLDNKIRPWKQLRIIFIGGGPANEKLIQQAIDNNYPIVIVYGSTETSSMVTFCSTENIVKNGISAGKPLENVKIEIVNSEDVELPKNEIGKIVIKSKSVADSYLNSLEPKSIRNGKYYSNDLGKVDDNGNLHIIGREDDIIISGGENISLSEIKNLISDKFSFNNFTTLAIKDKKWGQSYLLIIEAEKSVIIKNEVEKVLKSNIGKYKLPKKIIFMNEIPRTELGKIKKNELMHELKLNDL